MPAAKVHRAESLRSERSDASLANKRVSFNADVDVKHIPRGAVVDRNGRLLGYLPPGDHRRLVYNVYKQPTALSEQQLAQEAERIIQQVDQIACTVSANPAAPPAPYETRSLERRPRKNNQVDSGRQVNSAPANWSRTLPATSTKNKLENSPKPSPLLEKNVLHSNQVNQVTPVQVSKSTVDQLMEAPTSLPATSDLLAPSKYDSGIEMDQRLERPTSLGRNVNLIVRQLTEEARQREQWIKQLEDDEELAPRGVIQPDPAVGRTHNKNLPFSYTGGSPTRLSTLRRLSPPRHLPPEDETPAATLQRTRSKNDIVYAQVVIEAKDQSPERNLYRSTNGLADKVPPKQFHQPEVIRQRSFQQPAADYRRDDDDDDDDDDQQDDDLDALKAKAKFLFGDDGERRRGRQPTSLAAAQTAEPPGERYAKYPAGRNDVARDQNGDWNTRYRNEANSSKQPALGYRYSSLLKEQPSGGGGGGGGGAAADLTTRILISTDNQARERVFQYSDDDDLDNKLIERQRSVTPERPRPLVRPEAARPNLMSIKLIQEAERGRAAVRRPEYAAPGSQQAALRARYHALMDDEPPKPPIRTKKLRERMEPSPPPRPSNQRVAFQNLEPSGRWQDYAEPNGNHGADRRPSPSPQRGYNPSPSYRRKESPPRSQHPQHPLHPLHYATSDNRRYVRRHERSSSPEVHVQLVPSRSRYDESDGSATLRPEPEKSDKIRRQRNKFLSVFLGKSSKSGVSNKNRIPPAHPEAVESARRQMALGRPLKSAAKWHNASETSDGYDSTLRRADAKPPAKGQARPSADWQDDADGRHRSVKVSQAPRQQTRFAVREPPHRSAGKENKIVVRQRRTGSADRTDTSESDDARRFRGQRQKSQSFTNLQYRRADRDSDDEDADRRGRATHWATLDSAEIRRRRGASPDRPSGGLRYQRDARPYASTNVIHETEELRTGMFDERSRRPPASNSIRVNNNNIINNNNNYRQPLPIPQSVRYFGDTDLESQQSGNRCRYAPRAKISRSASTAAGVGAVRRGVMQRQSAEKQPLQKQPLQKQPSSVNSSESESQASNMQSGASADSQRSVYLHATTVADIPPATLVSQRQRRSREDLSKISASSGGSAERATLSRHTRQISRSYSVLAPWKPRHYREKYHISYSNQQQPTGENVLYPTGGQVVNDVGKPPRPPRRREEAPATADAAPVEPLGGGAPRPTVARSSTMPKDSKLAGWFRKKKRV